MSIGRSADLRTELAEWELTPEQLAMIFALMGWLYGTPDCQGVPGPEDIEDMVEHLADSMDKQGFDLVFSTMGRILLARHEEFPSSFGVYLHIGELPRKEDE